MAKVTRRQFSHLLAGSTLAVSAFGSRSFAAPRKGGALIVAFDGAAVVKFNLDTHNSGFAPHNRVIRSIYDNLVALRDDQTIAPWLAKSWEISADQKTYLFKLRTDVKFHDGSPFNAAAVKANLDRIKDRANALTSFSAIGSYDHSEVIADDAVKVTLSEPFAPFLRNLSSTKLGIVSPAAVEKFGNVFGQNPVGTGPFRFEGLTQGTDIRLARNEAYRWPSPVSANPGPAYLDRLVFKNVPDESTRVAVLQSGEAHAADLIPPQNQLALRSDRNFRLLQRELLETNYSLSLNVSKAPWDDVEIRQAVRQALDLDAIVRIVYLGTLQRAWSSLSPSMLGSAEKELAKSWQPDPKRAAAILDRKGWLPAADGIRQKDGKRLALSIIDTQGNREKRLDVIQLVRRQLRQVGIDLRIDSQSSGMYAQKVANNEFELSAGASFHADPDVLRTYFAPTRRSPLLATRVDDPELTAWLTAAAASGDAAVRADLYKKAQRLISDKVYAIPVYILLYNIAAASQVSGIALDAHGFPDFSAAWLGV